MFFLFDLYLCFTEVGVDRPDAGKAGQGSGIRLSLFLTDLVLLLLADGSAAVRGEGWQGCGLAAEGEVSATTKQPTDPYESPHGCFWRSPLRSPPLKLSTAMRNIL